MALKDHGYVIPAYHEEVPNLNLFLQDHTYAQRPVIQIQEQQEQEEKDQPQAEEQEEVQPQEEEEPQARTYRTIIPGIRLNSKFYVDNFGYKYYKKVTRQ